MVAGLRLPGGHEHAVQITQKARLIIIKTYGRNYGQTKRKSQVKGYSHACDGGLTYFFFTKNLISENNRVDLWNG